MKSLINAMGKVKPTDKKRYVLGEKRDYLILDKIYKLEKQKLSPDEKKMLKLIRTQLEADWRKPLLKTLEKMTIKYSKNDGKKYAK